MSKTATVSADDLGSAIVAIMDIAVAAGFDESSARSGFISTYLVEFFKGHARHSMKTGHPGARFAFERGVIEGTRAYHNEEKFGETTFTITPDLGEPEEDHDD